MPAALPQREQRGHSSGAYGETDGSDLPDDVREALRVRAARHRRSTEAEVRAIFIEPSPPPPTSHSAHY
ncbi:FitA-like ribbon-helix-helix domain-containing protein [Nocardia paucivorans]|uniref:FitA-like ribbon-helix-helix domain-containing protein n=1 Tax=Nocardia paucivorans TaxID=114259 RepID=UPI003570D8FB